LHRRQCQDGRGCGEDVEELLVLRHVGIGWTRICAWARWMATRSS
jgi:hypothetical protein